jgi:hypothetical protein
VPVTITTEPPCVPVPPGASSAIEIEVPGGYRVRVGSGVEGKALRLVLDVLARR